MPLSKEEIAINHRFRAFRESLYIAKATFAVQIMIGTERLASYESGRAPLPYFVFRNAAVHFALSPFWLATGEGMSTLLAPYDDSEIVPKISERALFSEIYDKYLRSAHEAQIVRISEVAENLLKGLKIVNSEAFHRRLSEEEKEKFFAAIDKNLRDKLFIDSLKMADKARLKPFLKTTKQKNKKKDA